MTEGEREARRLRLFLTRVQRDQQAVSNVHQRLQLAVERVRSAGPDAVTVGATALYLQNLYTAIEEVFRRVAADLDGSVPDGEDWHRDLLEQMTFEIADVRPQIIGEPLHGDLDLLRRFRHIVRHAYAVDYDWEEMRTVLAAASRAATALPEALAGLEVAVGAAIRELEGES